ncbi:MAG: amidohydrolase family protein, partial [Planctomycetota bacterium]
MIIDLNTRIWNSIEELGASTAEAYRRRREKPWDFPSAPADAHAAAMEPVAYAAILGFESGLLGASIDAESVAEAVRTRPDKNVGFVGIDPSLGKPVAKLEAALDMGLVGATVSPSAAGFHPADTKAMDLFEACQDKGVPVVIECNAMMSRDVKLEFAMPYLLDEIARAFPELKLVISSFGMPWIDQCVTMMVKHPHVYADVSGLVVRSWQLYNALVQAYQSGVMGQVLFGSGF